MATLYCDRQVLSIVREGESIVLRDGQGRRNNLPFNLLDRLVVRGRVEIDTSTLAHLADRGVTVSILSGRHSRLQAVVTGDPGKEARRRLGQARAHDDRAWVLAWGRRLVAMKLRSQHQFLGNALEIRPDARFPLRKGMEGIARLRKKLSEEKQPDPQILLGVEGSASRIYFEAYAAILPPSMEFEGRNRRPPKDPVNAMLSLGYTLLHAEAVQALWSVGLDPYLGFYHRLAHGRESLAADLIEPLRVRIDRLCWDLCRQRIITAGHFSHEKSACLLNKAGRHSFYSAYERQMPPVRRALRRLSQTLAKRFSDFPPAVEA